MSISQVNTPFYELKDNNIQLPTTVSKINSYSITSSKMEEQLILCDDQHVEPLEVGALGFVPKASCSQTSGLPTDTKKDEVYYSSGEEEPLIQSIECRICQEEDSIKNLEVPCACSGSLKFAHRKCVQRWCNEKRDIICEICHQVPLFLIYSCFAANLFLLLIVSSCSGNWTLSGTPLDLNDPRVLAMASAEQRLVESDYDEYEDTNASGASLCRSVAIILMALLLLRHALTIGDGDSDDDDDPSVFFALFLLRAAGFLLPCYIMIWAISILQRRRQAQEVETLAAADVAFMIQAGQHGGLQVTIAPGTAMAPSPMATPPSHSINKRTIITLLSLSPTMGIANCRVPMMMIFVCIILSTQSEKVSARRNIDLAFRWGEERLFSRHSRVLKVDELVNIAPTPAMMFDPNQSNKRRIRRGSDPIHNTR
ncbi:hypothetical protein E3N88_25481 [Mikania micrantha]|uniref:RING-CH-type domain-containing protein n=1 Tax=Mikania micrantha TaxID=192012 RepID=A0A5N6N6C9_9ASTR|nr:hypothetical protein E3N88_25481 [Mikania micrantha]